jgi:Single-strand binding protein family
MNPSKHANPQRQVIQLTGRLTRDNEVTPLENGSQVCHLRLAVESVGRGGETGYVDVSTFGKPGEAAGRTLSKGLARRRRRPSRLPPLGRRRRRQSRCDQRHRKRRVPRRPRAAPTAVEEAAA